MIAALEASLAGHVDQYHAFDAEQLRIMVKEHRELYDDFRPLALDTNKNVNLLVKEIYGTLTPTAADPLHRDGGMIALLEQMNSAIAVFTAQAANGGIPTHRKWTTGQWTFYGTIGAAFVAMATAISVAVLGG